MTTYHQALELQPKGVWVYSRLSTALLELGRIPEAEAASLKSMEPGSHYMYDRLLGNRAFVLIRQGRYAEAEPIVRQALQLNPDAFSHYLNLGVILNKQNRPKDAEHQLRRAIELAPDQPNPHKELAICLELQGRHVEQEAALRRVLQLQPSDPYALNNLAWYLATCEDVTRRDPARAVELATLAIAQAGARPETQNTLGVAYYRAGRWHDAIAALTKSIERGNGNESADWFFLAMSHWQLGHQDRAKKAFARGVTEMDKQPTNNPELKRFRAEAAELLEIKPPARP